MALTRVKGKELIVGSFQDEFQSKQLGFQELQNRLTELDLRNDDQVAKEVKRCNNRCNGNDVDADLTLVKAEGEPRIGAPSQKFQISFRFEGEA